MAVATLQNVVAQNVRNLFGNDGELRNALVAYLLARYKRHLDIEGDVLIICVAFACRLPATESLTLNERVDLWREAGEALEIYGEVDELRAIIRDCRRGSELDAKHLAKAFEISKAKYMEFENGGPLPETVSLFLLRGIARILNRPLTTPQDLEFYKRSIDNLTERPDAEGA